MKLRRSLGAPALLLALVGARLAAQDPGSRAEHATQSWAGLDYTYSGFFGDIAAWSQGALSIGRRTDRGTLIGHVNGADRFGTSGLQYEAEAYPVINKSWYAYLDAGYSTAAVFPKWRSGAEVFTALPNAWEASLGYRQLRFGGAPVTLLTGAVGKYEGNYWFSLRPYVRDMSTGTSFSLGLTSRRYFADADNFVGARFGAGSTPNDVLNPADLARTNSFAGDVHGSRAFAPGKIGTWVLSLGREELTASHSRNRVDVSFGMKLRY